MIALVVGAAQQTPIQIQCVQQTSTESWVKWLLPTIVQTVVSLVSITAGVSIALWSFREASKKEHRAWVMDQKTAEWKGLLARAAEMDNVIPPELGENQYETAAKQLLSTTHELQKARASSIFVADLSKETIAGFALFLKNATEAAETITKCKSEIPLISFGLSEKDKARAEDASERMKTAYGQIRGDYVKFIDWLRSEAQKDLEIAVRKVSDTQG